MWVRSLGQEDLLEQETATHSTILAWKIPRKEEPGGLQSRGSQKSDTTEHVCTIFILKKNPDLNKFSGYPGSKQTVH